MEYLNILFLRKTLGNKRNFALVATLASLSLCAFYFRATIKREIDLVLLSQADCEAFARLKGIDAGLRLVEVDIAEMANKVKESKKSRYLQEIAQISSDLDYIYSELDQVRGGELIKSERKLIVSRAHALTSVVDSWV